MTRSRGPGFNCLPLPCSVIVQDNFENLKVLVHEWKRWLQPDMTEKSFAGALNHYQTKVLINGPEIIIFLNSVLRPFQDYFSSYETGQSVGWAKTGEPREKPLKLR